MPISSEGVPQGSEWKHVDSEPLVSVVTPFYNTREFLAECIESVLWQSYQNWEYILLNNCSTDGSGEIAEYYANKHPDRIHLEHNRDFLSQVQNYNQVLRLISSRSKYCKFVQADDWLFPDCVKSMVKLAESHPDVGIVGAYELAGHEVGMDGLSCSITEISGHDVCRLYLLGGKYVLGTPTTVLLVSNLVRSRDPFFDERFAPFEDAHAWFDVLKKCNFGFSHQILAFSRRDNDGILSAARTFNFEPLLRLSVLIIHGRHFLDEHEFQSRRRELEREYFLYLCKRACAVHSASREFWNFHRRGLASMNYSLGAPLLAPWFPRAVLEKSWEGFWARWDKLFS